MAFLLGQFHRLDFHSFYPHFCPKPISPHTVRFWNVFIYPTELLQSTIIGRVFVSSNTNADLAKVNYYDQIRIITDQKLEE